MNESKPTVYISAHYPDRPASPVHLTVTPDPDGGFNAKPARGGPVVASGTTVGETVEKALDAERRGQA